MTSYYVQAYKTGSYPTVTDDKIYIWARPHPKNAIAVYDPVGPPNNFQMVGILPDILSIAGFITTHLADSQTQDLMWAVVFARAPCDVDLWTSDTNTQTFTVPAGVTKLSMPLTETGGFMRARLRRNGAIVTDFAPSNYFYQSTPQTYNFNAFTASSTTSTQRSKRSGNSSAGHYIRHTH